MLLRTDNYGSNKTPTVSYSSTSCILPQNYFCGRISDMDESFWEDLFRRLLLGNIFLESQLLNRLTTAKIQWNIEFVKYV